MTPPSVRSKERYYMYLNESGSLAPKYRITRFTICSDKVVDEEVIFFYDKVHLEGEHPCYDCGIHDDFSFVADSQAPEYYLYTFQKFNGRYWVDTDDPRTPDQLCETCVLHTYDARHHSSKKKIEKEVDYYEGDWNSFPALQ